MLGNYPMLTTGSSSSMQEERPSFGGKDGRSEPGFGADQQPGATELTG
jgi:hypothetical protein